MQGIIHVDEGSLKYRVISSPVAFPGTLHVFPCQQGVFAYYSRKSEAGMFKGMHV